MAAAEDAGVPSLMLSLRMIRWQIIMRFLRAKDAKAEAKVPGVASSQGSFPGKVFLREGLEVTEDQKKLAVSFFESESYFLIPPAWYSPNSAALQSEDQWLYARKGHRKGSGEPLLTDRVFGEEDFEAMKLVTFTSRSLAEVHALRKSLRHRVL
ncbi:hypothetical protein FOL47_001402 [Perkinsus chesapeaki]|uniref:Uncharacterized protein n=1 Tax=Perkinsus chesapeaki TaxID=330153 RepID=A0A7J6KS38_PERCH|nr:hypothetical protein FOL47_001402 [Perkinsus chesapeaki]